MMMLLLRQQIPLQRRQKPTKCAPFLTNKENRTFTKAALAFAQIQQSINACVDTVVRNTRNTVTRYTAS